MEIFFFFPVSLICMLLSPGVLIYAVDRVYLFVPYDFENILTIAVIDANICSKDYRMAVLAPSNS